MARWHSGCVPCTPGGNECLRRKHSDAPVPTGVLANLHPHRRASSFARKCITFAKASMARAPRSRRSPSACRKRAVPASSCRRLDAVRNRRRARVLNTPRVRHASTRDLRTGGHVRFAAHSSVRDEARRRPRRCHGRRRPPHAAGRLRAAARRRAGRLGRRGRRAATLLPGRPRARASVRRVAAGLRPDRPAGPTTGPPARTALRLDRGCPGSRAAPVSG